MVNRIDLLIKRIQGEIDERRITVADLVRQSGASQSSVYNLMGGKRGVEPATLKLIGFVLDIPTLELAYYIGLSDEMPSGKAVLNDVFVAEWNNAPEQRRKELLMILRTLNAIDKDSKGVSGRS